MTRGSQGPDPVFLLGAGVQYLLIQCSVTLQNITTSGNENSLHIYLALGRVHRPGAVFGSPVYHSSLCWHFKEILGLLKGDFHLETAVQPRPHHWQSSHTESPHPPPPPPCSSLPQISEGAGLTRGGRKKKHGMVEMPRLPSCLLAFQLIHSAEKKNHCRLDLGGKFHSRPPQQSEHHNEASQSFCWFCLQFAKKKCNIYEAQ